MKLAYTILYVENVAATLAFYEKAFGFVIKFAHQGGDYGELETGATTLAFSSRKLMAELGKNPQAPNAGAPVFEIALSTDDVPAALDMALKAGAKLIHEPQRMPWGQTIAYVADPNGFLIEICTPVSNG